MKREVSTPLDRMEEALQPKNMHTIKALPTTSWHLTIILEMLNKLLLGEEIQRVRNTSTKRKMAIN